jgi:hypothetical protein
MKIRDWSKLAAAGVAFAMLMVSFWPDSSSGGFGPWGRWTTIALSTTMLVALGWKMLFKPTRQQVPSLVPNQPQRRLSDAADDDLRTIIVELFPRDKAWEIVGLHGDPEAWAYAHELQAFMAQHGFNLASRGVIRAIFDEPVTDLRIKRKADRYRLIVGSAPDAVRSTTGPRGSMTGSSAVPDMPGVGWLHRWSMMRLLRPRQVPSHELAAAE